MRHIPRLVLILATVFHGTLRAAPMTDSEIREMVKYRVAQLRPGASIVVGLIDRDGPRIIAEGFTDRTGKRPADGDTVYEIGSVTKAFTALLLAEMAAKGEVRLDDPVQRYLPSSVRVPAEGERQITLLDLAAHRSGLPRDDSWPRNRFSEQFKPYGEADLYRFLSGRQLQKPIGTTLYSNIAYILLGHALGLSAHQSFDSLLRERISEPLAMHSTGIAMTPAMRRRHATGYRKEDGSEAPARNPGPPGNGVLKSTANDMLRFLAACMQLAPTPLDAAVARLNAAGDAAARPGWDHRLKRRDADIWLKNGRTYGFASIIAHDVRSGKGVVVLSNTGALVDDIGVRALFRDFPPSHNTVPWPFEEAMIASGYRDMLAGYRAFRHRDPAFQLAEGPLNEWGGILLMQGKARQAVEVLKLGVHLRPRSANAHDSLAEAHEKAGDKEQAVLSYRASLALDPGNGNAAKRLQVLEGGAKE